MLQIKCYQDANLRMNIRIYEQGTRTTCLVFICRFVYSFVDLDYIYYGYQLFT